ncbi:MAG: hypothetical protein ABSG99_04900 [Sedimentisphaerales bacterium]
MLHIRLTYIFSGMQLVWRCIFASSLYCKKYWLELVSDGEQSHPEIISNALVNTTLGNFNAKSLCAKVYPPMAD